VRPAREEAPDDRHSVARTPRQITSRRSFSPGEAFFMSETPHLGPDEIARTIRRLAHEIVENNHGTERLVLVGLLSRGFPLAKRLANAIEAFEDTVIPVGSLDIGLYRDDVSRLAAAHRGAAAPYAAPTARPGASPALRPSLGPSLRPSSIPAIDGATVVLVDDVLFTGRSIRAAMDALMDFGRPACMRLAVLVDRGHRELPIRPDFVGKNIPTALVQSVRVRLAELDGEDAVYVQGEAPDHA